MQALDFITAALTSIGTLRAGSAPSAAQGSDGLKNLNRILASLAGDGIDFGHAPTSTLTADIPVPLEHQDAVIALLAKKEASDRGVEPPNNVLETADKGYQRMLREALLLSQEPASLSTVSKGSGSVSTFNILTG